MKEALMSTVGVCRLLGRSSVTILSWRRFRDFPFIAIPGEGKDAIRFERKAVLAWAKANGIAIQGDNAPSTSKSLRPCQS